MVDKIYTPHDFDLRRLDFISSDGSVTDLRAIMVELNIFEDIFANVMSGNLVVTDSKNFFSYIPVQGNEFLDIVLDKPTLDKPIRKLFRIYNKDSIPVKLSNQTIILKFCSEELLISKSMIVSKSYQDILISDIVKDIAYNFLKIPDKIFPDTHIETTKNIWNCVIPSYNPFQTLNWMASKAISSYVGATYLFYENQKGFYFQSLQKLMDTSPQAVYNHNMKNVKSPHERNMNLDFYDITKYEIVKTSDTLDSLQNGRYSGRLITIDLLRQRYEVGNLNGQDLFNSSQKLNSGRPFSNFVDRTNNQLSNSYGGYTKFYPTNLGQDNAKYINGKQSIIPTNIEQWLIERNAQLMQILGNRMKLLVPGNCTLKIGDIITVNLPSIEPQTGKSEGERDRKLDPYLSGNYIICALRHRVVPASYETVIEVCRDSLRQSFQSSSKVNTSSGDIL